MLELPDHWVWDSWVVDDGDAYHLFFLKAERGLVDPGLRHTAARIGHAVSTDLTHWDYLGDALTPAESGWDDLALWTGSVVCGDDGDWRMFYTALSSAGRGVFDQRIGVVQSDDLSTWHRAGPDPVVSPNAVFYKTLDDDATASETWRDPFVFRDPGGDGWHMLITARAAGATRFDDGVLAHARSADLQLWQLGPPISNSAGFGQIEVPQVRLVDGSPLLVFTCHPDEQSEARKAAYGRYCTWSVAGESMLGPFDLSGAEPFRAEPALFAAPLVQQRDRTWAFIGFRNTEPEGVFAFDILDPIPVQRRGASLVAVGGSAG